MVVTLSVVWAAAWVDFRTFRIPNTIVLLGIALGMSILTWGAGLEGLWQSLGGILVALVLLFPFYVFGHMGAGDVKLMGAVGALLGPEQLLMALFITLVAAGLMGVAYALTAWRRQGATGPAKRYGQMLRFLWVTGRPSYIPPAQGEAMAVRLPVAVPIAIGSTAVILWSL
nr:A24 family peptidase [Thiocystis violacea]